MEATNEKIIKDIQYYQQRMERYIANKNDAKILNAIQKLSKLPINTVHLENTGVGRSVNALKKYGGEVSKASKELVSFWKEMVLHEDKSQEDSQVEHEEEVDSVYSSDNEMGNDSEEEDNGPKENYSGHPINNEDMMEKVNCDSNDEDTVEQNEEYKEEYENDASKSHKHSKMKVSKNVSAKPCTTTNSDCTYSDDENSSTKSNFKRNHMSESSQYDIEEKHKAKKIKHDGHSPYEYKSMARRNESDFKHKSKSDGSDESNIKKQDSKRKENKSEHVDRKSSSHSDKQDSKKSKLSSSDKHVKPDKPKQDSKKLSESSGTRQLQDKKEKHSSKYSDKEKLDTEKSTSKHKSKKKDKHDKKNKTNDVDLNKGKIVHGIGSDSGASFAEALGMCGPTVSNKKKTSSSNSSKVRSKVDSPSTNSSSQPKIQPEPEDLVPELLKEPQLEPLNINIFSLLPEITPNYKPLGFPLDCQQKRLISDDEALSRVMSNKNQRTKVYSGNKTVMKVESLFQLCIRILQDNIDALEYTGGVPYLILKPILEKATPDQLFNMEHHNPYLIEDTDELWKLHCQREFKTKKRQEMESWRDMYMRCLDEREARLSFITANIKQSQDKSMPIRTTKLAYVDSFVKPPRNVARQQARHGTSAAKPSTSMKLVELAKSGEAGKVSVPNPGSRGGDRGSSSSSTGPMKVKKAPLMAKTLSFLKNRFKR